MSRNFFKIAFRNFLKNRIYASINIIGLALGLTCSLLIYLWMNDELNIDAFHKKGDRIYTIISREYIDGTVTGYYDTPGLLGEELKKVMPEIEFSCNFSSKSLYTFSVGDEKLKYEGNFAGEDYFKIFSVPLLQGTAETALKAPESISISRKMATAFFGSPEQALHQSIRFDNYRDLEVAAVFEDLQDNSSVRFDCLINWAFFKEREPWIFDWDNSGPGAFALLKANADPEKVNAKLKDFIANYTSDYDENDHLELGLQPYEEMYLHSNFENGEIAGGRIEYVRIFGIVAVFILLIACINFMNLSTAQSLKRAKEIGVRKVIGAKRGSLIGQFLGESLLFSGLAVIVSLLVVSVLLPIFNQFTEKSIALPFSNTGFWLFILGLTTLTGLFSGTYSAFFLSGFRPMSVLKNTLKITGSSITLRKCLVVFQFALSIVFIISMMVISRQIDYIYSKNLGYEKSNLIYIPKVGSLSDNYAAFKNEAAQKEGILSLSNMHLQFTNIENTTGSVEWPGKTPNTHPNFREMAIGYDFLKTIKAELAVGREFSKVFADSANYVINEAALKVLGFQDPIGKPLTFWGVKGQIVGVVKDFHFSPLHQPIEPLIMRLTKEQSWGYALVRTEEGKMKLALSALEKLHKKLNPDFPFTYQFVDAEYQKLYGSENVIQQLSKYFAGLAILISCLGLLGLVIFSTEQRTKEIGIRKVLGASVTSLWQLLSKDFVVLVLISCLIATPIAYYFMNEWLQKYSYRIEISWWVFAVAIIGALLITLLTVSYQAFKAALVNPVKSLKSE